MTQECDVDSILEVMVEWPGDEEATLEHIWLTSMPLNGLTQGVVPQTVAQEKTRLLAGRDVDPQKYRMAIKTDLLDPTVVDGTSDTVMNEDSPVAKYMSILNGGKIYFMARKTV